MGAEGPPPLPAHPPARQLSGHRAALIHSHLIRAQSGGHTARWPSSQLPKAQRHQPVRSAGRTKGQTKGCLQIKGRSSRPLWAVITGPHSKASGGRGLHGGGESRGGWGAGKQLVFLRTKGAEGPGGPLHTSAWPRVGLREPRPPPGALGISSCSPEPSMALAQLFWSAPHPLPPIRDSGRWGGIFREPC